MNIRTAASVALIIFALGLTFFLFVKPVLQPRVPAIISETDLVPAALDADGVKTYYHFKEEVKDWMKILAPVITFLVAWGLKGKSSGKA